MHGCDSKAVSGRGQGECLPTPIEAHSAVVVAVGEGVAGGASTGAGPKATEISCNRVGEGVAGGDAGNVFRTLEVRARRCKCGVCPTCASSVAWKESQRVQAVISNWQFPQMWTFTLNPSAYPDQRRILEWIKAKKCIATLVQSLWRKKLLRSRNYYAVMEFQDGSRNVEGRGTEQVHFHVLLDTPGFLDKRIVWELWESKAPPWRATGNVCDKHNPAMGFVRFDKVYEGEGLAAYLSKGVAGYLSKGPKNLPEWFIKYLDDGHNMQLKYASRGFWASLPKREKGYTRPPVTAKRKRRTVSERLANCKHDADAYIIVDGKPVWLDRCVWSWEETMKLLGPHMSPEVWEQCEKAGRVCVNAAELLRVAGLEGYKRMVEKNGGMPVGLANFRDAELHVLKRWELPALQVSGDAEADFAKLLGAGKGGEGRGA
jgi:hypothetical protein